MMDFQATRWLMDGVVPPQAGNDHPTAIPTGVFKTMDGHINIAASGQRMFRRLCKALGIEPLADDPRFREPAERSRNRHELTVEVERVLSQRASSAWVEILNAQGVPAGPILNMKEVFENEQIKHLRMAEPVRHPALGEIRIQGRPVVLSRTPGELRSAASDLGEHTDQILVELGFSLDDIGRFHKERVV